MSLADESALLTFDFFNGYQFLMTPRNDLEEGNRVTDSAPPVLNEILRDTSNSGGFSGENVALDRQLRLPSFNTLFQPGTYVHSQQQSTTTHCTEEAAWPESQTSYANPIVYDSWDLYYANSKYDYGVLEYNANQYHEPPSDTSFYPVHIQRQNPLHSNKRAITPAKLDGPGSLQLMSGPLVSPNSDFPARSRRALTGTAVLRTRTVTRIKAQPYSKQVALHNIGQLTLRLTRVCRDRFVEDSKDASDVLEGKQPVVINIPSDAVSLVSDNGHPASNTSISPQDAPIKCPSRSKSVRDFRKDVEGNSVHTMKRGTHRKPMYRLTTGAELKEKLVVQYITETKVGASNSAKMLVDIKLPIYQIALEETLRRVVKGIDVSTLEGPGLYKAVVLLLTDKKPKACKSDADPSCYLGSSEDFIDLRFCYKDFPELFGVLCNATYTHLFRELNYFLGNNITPTKLFIIAIFRKVIANRGTEISRDLKAIFRRCLSLCVNMLFSNSPKAVEYYDSYCTFMEDIIDIPSAEYGFYEFHFGFCTFYPSNAKLVKNLQRVLNRRNIGCPPIIEDIRKAYTSNNLISQNVDDMLAVYKSFIKKNPCSGQSLFRLDQINRGAIKQDVQLIEDIFASLTTRFTETALNSGKPTTKGLYSYFRLDDFPEFMILSRARLSLENIAIAE